MSETYVAIAPCGCIRAVLVYDGPGTDTATMREAMRRGYAVRLLPSAMVRAMSWRCALPGCPFQQTTSHGGAVLLPLEEEP